MGCCASNDSEKESLLKTDGSVDYKSKGKSYDFKPLNPNTPIKVITTPKASPQHSLTKQSSGNKNSSISRGWLPEIISLPKKHIISEAIENLNRNEMIEFLNILINNVLPKIKKKDKNTKNDRNNKSLKLIFEFNEYLTTKYKKKSLKNKEIKLLYLNRFKVSYNIWQIQSYFLEQLKLIVKNKNKNTKNKLSIDNVYLNKCILGLIKLFNNCLYNIKYKFINGINISYKYILPYNKKYSNNVPIVFVCDCGMVKEDFSNLISYYRKNRPVLVYDLRGMGQTIYGSKNSSNNNSNDINSLNIDIDNGNNSYQSIYTVHLLTSDLISLLEYVFGKNKLKLYLFGIGLGGMILQMLAIRFPYIIKGLIISGSCCGGRFEPNLNNKFWYKWEQVINNTNSNNSINLPRNTKLINLNSIESVYNEDLVEEKVKSEEEEEDNDDDDNDTITNHESQETLGGNSDLVIKERVLSEGNVYSRFPCYMLEANNNNEDEYPFTFRAVGFSNQYYNRNENGIIPLQASIIRFQSQGINLINLKCPILILHGTEDKQFIIDCSKYIYTQCINSNKHKYLHKLDYCGHLWYLENNETYKNICSNIIDDFINNIEINDCSLYDLDITNIIFKNISMNTNNINGFSNYYLEIKSKSFITLDINKNYNNIIKISLNNLNKYKQNTFIILRDLLTVESIEFNIYIDDILYGNGNVMTTSYEKQKKRIYITKINKNNNNNSNNDKNEEKNDVEINTPDGYNNIVNNENINLNDYENINEDNIILILDIEHGMRVSSDFDYSQIKLLKEKQNKNKNKNNKNNNNTNKSEKNKQIINLTTPYKSSNNVNVSQYIMPSGSVDSHTNEFQYLKQNSFSTEHNRLDSRTLYELDL